VLLVLQSLTSSSFLQIIAYTETELARVILKRM
jgi:hypothetical protein